jgi:two-component sensor histidine kinase
VINALKHGYPGHARGRIFVDYRSIGPDWSLSVRDDGIGISTGARKAEAGLGTGIVEALAKHLGADIEVIAAKPGVETRISHRPNLN